MNPIYYGTHAATFDFVKNPGYRSNFINAHRAITNCELWDWLSTYSPPIESGFLFSKSPELDRIYKLIDDDYHSGTSLAITMRTMEYIAKNGYDGYRTYYLSSIN